MARTSPDEPSPAGLHVVAEEADPDGDGRPAGPRSRAPTATPSRGRRGRRSGPGTPRPGRRRPGRRAASSRKTWLQPRVISSFMVLMSAAVKAKAMAPAVPNHAAPPRRRPEPGQQDGQRAPGDHGERHDAPSPRGRGSRCPRSGPTAPGRRPARRRRRWRPTHSFQVSGLAEPDPQDGDEEGQLQRQDGLHRGQAPEVQGQELQEERGDHHQEARRSTPSGAARRRSGSASGSSPPGRTPPPSVAGRWSARWRMPP